MTCRAEVSVPLSEDEWFGCELELGPGHGNVHRSTVSGERLGIGEPHESVLVTVTWPIGPEVVESVVVDVTLSIPV